MAARSVPAGYMARRIEALRAGGMTRAQVREATGIGERTQRKLLTGQTSGAKLIQKQIKTAKRLEQAGREKGTLAVLVKDENGKVTSVDIIAPKYNQYRRLSPLDQAVIAAEPKVKTAVASELERKRGNSGARTPLQVASSTIIGVRAIARAHYAGIPLIML
jgi:hypothetical protein